MGTRGSRTLSRIGFALLALVAVAAAGCGGGGDSSGGSTAKAGKGGTLRLAQESEVTTLDPARTVALSDINVLNQIVEGLFRSNAEEEIEPWLAESFEKSADLRKWTFHLRPGVKFSDGQPMTAADVVFSIEAARKSPVWSALYTVIDTVRAVDPQTVEIKTSASAPALPDVLALFPAAIVPDNYGGLSPREYFANPIGTGPFVLASWKRGQTMTLERNPEYWKPNRPLLDQVVFVTAANDSSRVSQLRAGELDAIAKPAWAELSGLEQAPGVAVQQAEDGLTGSLILNARRPLLKEARARDAVNLALNREGITEAAARGYGKPAVSWFPLSLRYADKSMKPPAQDVAKAKQLLDEAVAASGQQPNLELAFRSEEEYGRSSAQVIQQNLEEAGFKITLKPVDAAAWGELIPTGEFDMDLETIYSNLHDPIEYAGYWPATESLYSGGDVSQSEALVKQAEVETDPDRRRDIYYEFQRLLAADNYVVNVNNLPFVWVTADDVSGFELNSTGTIWLSDVGFAE